VSILQERREREGKRTTKGFHDQLGCGAHNDPGFSAALVDLMTLYYAPFDDTFAMVPHVLPHLFRCLHRFPVRARKVNVDIALAVLLNPEYAHFSRL
jgi:hypothetical protein